MQGSLRLILATLVVLEHLGHQLGGSAANIQSGVPAVIVFYILAGYVVAQLLHRYFGETSAGILRYYLERLLRIYPTYLFFLLATALFAFATGFGRPSLTPWSLFGNLAVVPLNYYWLGNVIVLADKRFWLIPTAWSLALEIQVYLLLPFVLRSSRSKWGVGCLSIILFGLGAFGVLDVDRWCYRCLPGVFFIFLAGSAIYRRRSPSADSFDKTFPEIVWISAVILLFLVGLLRGLRVPFLEVALGLIIGLPVVFRSSKTKFRLPLDNIFGSLSYGVFLAHFPVMWVLEYIRPSIYPASKEGTIVVIIGSLLLAAVATFGVEPLFWPARKRLSILRLPNSRNENFSDAVAITRT